MIVMIIATVLLVFSLFLFLTGVVGLFKFNYVLSRMHAVALGDTLGILCAIIGVVLLRGWSLISFKLLLIPVFMFLTGPVVTHLIAECETRYHRPTGREYKKEDRS